MNETTQDPPLDRDDTNRLRKLRLELAKIRSEANAARLEARAAELELQIAQLTGQQDSRVDGPPGPDTESDSKPRMRRFDAPSSRVPPPTAASTVGGRYIPARAYDRTPREAVVFHPRDSVGSASKPDPQKSPKPAGKKSNPPNPVLGSWQEACDLLENEVLARRAISIASEGAAVEEGEAENATRPRPAAWMVSVVVHTLILILLALFTLSNPSPGDQVALAGSVAETEEVAIESIEMESAELQPTQSEPTPAETTADLSDLGDLAVTDVQIDSPPAPPSPLVNSLMQSDATSSAALSMKSDSDSKMQFCGVEGGGNHFIYLVDSSGSMGDAFVSARRELLRSIELLKPEQRFYVVFFDAEPDYMRLSSPDRDEPRSVFATPENKAALRRWAMTVEMDRGRAPYDAIPFALDLSPDVIFLLSDGEFPQSIEDLLKETNRVNNLFGDDGPISIVHTIGYHSREGESRMRRIAKQNGGQYRHVPKP